MEVEKISRAKISLSQFKLSIHKCFCFVRFFHQLIVQKGKKRRDEGVFIHFLEESFVGKKEEAGGGKKAPPLH